jgi:hypothetical protein
MITSLYFDTDELDQYTRSVSGEFRKDKVRVRWYPTPGTNGGPVPVFIELKSREGHLSHKQRRQILVDPAVVEADRLHRGIVPGNQLWDTLASFGHLVNHPLRPIISISYWRYRLQEMTSGVRVTLDHEIRSTMVQRSLGHGERDLALPGGVIEVKGPSFEVPASFRRGHLLDLDWSRFSKYASCLDVHLSEPGTIARLSPSGRILEF